MDASNLSMLAHGICTASWGHSSVVPLDKSCLHVTHNHNVSHPLDKVVHIEQQYLAIKWHHCMLVLPLVLLQLKHAVQQVNTLYA
jgi:hypothetical protein